MITLRYNEKYLDLEKGQIGIEITNPLFDKSGIPGSVSYPFKLSGKSKVNKTAMRFAQHPGVMDPVNTLENVQLFMSKILWKIGKLNLLGGDEDYNVNFQGDAADLSELFSHKKLNELDLSVEERDMDVVSQTYPTALYTFFPVKNIEFYGDKNLDFKGYINYYHDGAFAVNTTTNDYCLVPFVYLVHVIKKIFEEHGWQVSGNWLDDSQVKKITIYNNYALDELDGALNVYADNINLANHMPDLTIGNFLVAIMNLFGLGYFFYPITKTVVIESWAEILAYGGYKDWRRKAAKISQWEMNRYNGITFKQQASSDHLTDIESFDWLESREDNGEKVIESMASPLLEIAETDTINVRDWTIPYIKQPGTSFIYPLYSNPSGLRLMFFDGFKNDNLDNPYPAGRYATASASLRWDGTHGLKAVYWPAFIDFLKNTRYELRDINLNEADLLSFDSSYKIFIDYQKYIIESVKVSVGDTGIQAAKVGMWRVR